jgi:hypothetical protein
MPSASSPRGRRGLRPEFLALHPLHLRRTLRDVRGRDLWAGIGRVVYGQTEKALKAQTGAHEENPTLDLHCGLVFAAGQRPTEVVGPLLEDEAARLQADFWKARG